MLKNYSESMFFLNLQNLEKPKSVLQGQNRVNCKSYPFPINPEVEEKADFSHIRAQSFVGRKLSCNIENNELFNLPNKRVQVSTPVSPT